MGIEEVIIGGTPWSAGYEWDFGKKCWLRPWEGECVNAPWWDKYIPEEEVKKFNYWLLIIIAAIVIIIVLASRK